MAAVIFSVLMRKTTAAKTPALLVPGTECGCFGCCDFNIKTSENHSSQNTRTRVGDFRSGNDGLGEFGILGFWLPRELPAPTIPPQVEGGKGAGRGRERGRARWGGAGEGTWTESGVTTRARECGVWRVARRAGGGAGLTGAACRPRPPSYK